MKETRIQSFFRQSVFWVMSIFVISISHWLCTRAEFGTVPILDNLHQQNCEQLALYQFIFFFGCELPMKLIFVWCRNTEYQIFQDFFGLLPHLQFEQTRYQMTAYNICSNKHCGITIVRKPFECFYGGYIGNVSLYKPCSVKISFISLTMLINHRVYTLIP